MAAAQNSTSIKVASIADWLPGTAEEIRRHLENGIIPFWSANARDDVYGGYQTCFDDDGVPLGTPEKYLNKQCRLLWWFSTLIRRYPGNPEYPALARHGLTFLLRYFWDETHGGWIWKVSRDGKRVDGGKAVYGQSFAIYALAEYALATGNTEASLLAVRTFDLLQIHCADTRFGGYREYFEHDWTPSDGGFHGGDRKTLDTHMHLLESFTVLYALSHREVHGRKLQEVMEAICDKMIDFVSGSGRNQFDLSFKPVAAIAIKRTWNAERSGQMLSAPTDTTSYGHNLELAWLLRRGVETVGLRTTRADEVARRLVAHAVSQGIDWECGGVYRDGTATGGPIVKEKEFWQNAEALVGLLDCYEHTGDQQVLEAFLNVWRFSRQHFVAPCGEWRVLLQRDGSPIDGHVGNNWKGVYHTGRAMLECLDRLERLQGKYL